MRYGQALKNDCQKPEHQEDNSIIICLKTIKYFCEPQLLMNLRTSTVSPITFVMIVAISVSLIAATSSIGQTANAQNQSQGQSTGNAPLNFYLKLNNNQTTSQAASQASSNGTGTKNITISVNVQKGPSGNIIKLPISAVVPNNINAEDLQLCASLSNGEQMCLPLGQNAPNIDLSSSANSTAKTTSQSYHNNNGDILDVWFSSIIQYADAQLISVNNTTLNIPITVIVPITLEIQNAQICASVASSGGQSCQQIVLNPTQSAFTPVNVDLSNPTTPTITTLSEAVITTQQLTGTTGNNATPSGVPSTQQTPAGNVSGNPSSNSSSELPNPSPNQPSPSSNPPSTTNDNPSSGESSDSNPSSSSGGSSPSGSDTGTSAESTPSDSDTGGSTSSP